MKRNSPADSATNDDAVTAPRPLYRVRNWDDKFENAQSRKCGKLNWVPVPNKHDGKGYRRLISAKNGPAMYGAWVVILQVASKCLERGVLADEDGPLNADDLSHKTGLPAELISTTLETLCQARIRWLEVEQVGADWQPTPNTPPSRSTDSPQNRMEPEPEAEQKRKTLKPASGVCDRVQKKKQPSVFDGLTADVLKDNAKLFAWIKNDASSGKRKVVNQTEHDALNVFAAAERALEDGHTPIALFIHIVGKKDWKLISNEQEDRARKRLNELRRQISSPPMRDPQTSTTISDPTPISESLEVLKRQIAARSPPAPTAPTETDAPRQ